MKSETKHGTDDRPVSYERVGNALVGVLVMTTVGLGYGHSPYWFLGTAAIAANLIVTAVLDRCVVKTLLIRLGMVGERDLGRAEIMGASSASDPVRIRDKFFPNRTGRAAGNKRVSNASSADSPLAAKQV